MLNLMFNIYCVILDFAGVYLLNLFNNVFNTLLDKETVMEENEKSWGIRGVPADARQAVINLAKKDGINVGEWITVAIREKIKNDRAQSRALSRCEALDAVTVETNPRNSVSLADASQALDMLERLRKMDIEPSDTLKRQATSLVRKCIVNVKRGGSVQHNPDFVQQDGDFV